MSSLVLPVTLSKACVLVSSLVLSVLSKRQNFWYLCGSVYFVTLRALSSGWRLVAVVGGRGLAAVVGGWRLVAVACAMKRRR